MNPFKNWSDLQVAEFNAKNRPRIETAVSLLAKAGEEKREKKTTQMLAANRSTKSEADIQQEIETFLKSLGTSCWFTRSRMDKATTQRVGIPDFVCLYRGVPFVIEAKRPGCKPTQEQQGEMLWWKLAGGHAKVCHSLDEAKQFLAEIVKQKP